MSKDNLTYHGYIVILIHKFGYLVHIFKKVVKPDIFDYNSIIFWYLFSHINTNLFNIINDFTFFHGIKSFFLIVYCQTHWLCFTIHPFCKFLLFDK